MTTAVSSSSPISLLTPGAVTPATAMSTAAAITAPAIAGGASAETSDFNAVLSPLLKSVEAVISAVGTALPTPDSAQPALDTAVPTQLLALPEGLDLTAVLQQTSTVAGNVLPVSGKVLPISQDDVLVEGDDDLMLPAGLPATGDASAVALPLHDVTAVLPEHGVADEDDELLAQLALPVATVPAPVVSEQQLSEGSVADASSKSDDGDAATDAQVLAAQQVLLSAVPAVLPLIQSQSEAVSDAAENADAETLITTVLLPSNSKPVAQRGETSQSAVAPALQSADSSYDPTSIEGTVSDMLPKLSDGSKNDDIVGSTSFGRLLEAQAASSSGVTTTTNHNNNAQQPAVDTAMLGSKTLTGAVAYRMEGNTQVATTLVNQPVDSPQWSNEIGERVVWFGANKIQHAEIELDPPELGPMQVRISTQNDQTTVTFTSHHAGVREVLDQNLPRLKEMFAEQGLNLVQADVGDRRGSQQQQQFEMGDAAGVADNAGADDDGDTAATGGTAATKLRLGLVDAYA
jgi:flagellar hook-length control protein FliK